MDVPSDNQPSKRVVMGGVMLAMLLGALDQTIVATAMPQVVNDLKGLEHLSWVFTAYMLASTVTVPIYGKLSDIYGRRGFYLAGIVIFLVGSMLCGLSRSMTQLIAFRGIQGIGGGAMMVNSIAIIGDLFPPAERGRWQGLVGGVFGLASVAGPLIGGWLTDHISWHWIFYINLPVGIVALTVIARVMPKIRPDSATRSIDYFGAVTVAAGLILLLLALVWGGSQYPWGSSEINGLFAASAACLIAFGVIEQKFAKDPILPLNLFGSLAFTVSMASTFLTSVGMYGAIAFLPLYAQSVIGFSATNSGLVLAPFMIGLILASAISGQIITRTGKYKASAVIGMAIAVIGMAMFSRLAVETSRNALIIDMIVLGFGLGVTFPIFTIVVQSAFDHSKLGVVTAAGQLFRSIGGTVGIAVMGGILNNSLGAQLTDIGSMPFVQIINRLNPDKPLTAVTTNTLQRYLSPMGQKGLQERLAAAPPGMQEKLQADSAQFITALKHAFAGSIGHVFMGSLYLMAVAFVITLFLPVIVLRRTHKVTLAEEAGKELEAGFVQVEARDEPALD